MEEMFAEPDADVPASNRKGVRAPLDKDAKVAFDRLVSGLNPAQSAAVTSDAAVLRIIAGAGSGKTRVLTRRIARRVIDGDVDPRRVLAVTFTRKAAAELRSRMGSLGLRGDINAGTFHAVAYTQLRQRWQERGITPPELLDRKVGFVARLMRSSSSTLPLEVVSEIEWAKARMISAGDYAQFAAAAERRVPVDLGVVADIYAKYERTKLDRRMVDFDDLLRLATRDIEADPEFAAARRWRFRHLFVDEFQDVNPLQFRLLQAWVGPNIDLCVVGDPNQAIYAWNGADSRFLDEFPDLFPGAETIELTENYRSSPQILGVANTVLTRTPSRRFELTPNCPDGAVPSIRSFDTEIAEAHGVARMLRDAHRPGASWSEQAVLVRTNAQLAIFEEAFRSAGIPFRSRGGTRFLDLPEIKDTISKIRRGGGSMTTRLADLDASLQAHRAEIIDESEADSNSLVSTSPGAAADDLDDLGADRLANVAELVRLGREFLALEPDGSVDSFLGWINAALRNDDNSRSSDAVDLVTFHAAKGLEWPQVYVAGMEEGLVPIHYAATPEAQAEEVRLLYVAITRAERQLTLTRADRRTFGTRTLTRKPSPLLEPVGLAIELLRASTSAIDLTAAVAAVSAERAKLRTTDGTGQRDRARRSSSSTTLTAEQDAVFQALKAWRRDTSKLANVPAFVIFNDATLTEIALQLPGSHRELLTVNGIGAVKAERFGPDVLRIVEERQAALRN